MESFDIVLLNKRLGFKFYASRGVTVRNNVKKVKNGYIITRTIVNDTDRVVKLKELKAEVTGISFNNCPENDFFYCNENARIFETLTIPLDYDRSDDSADINKKFALPVNRRWNDPGVREGRICSSPYQPFPAILLSNYNSSEGIVCGSLCQDVFYHSFDVGHRGGKAFLKICSSFKDIGFRLVLPKEKLSDVFYIGETFYADDINKIFDNYVKILRKRLKNNFGSLETNRHTLIWDSWNDGIYRDISEEMLLKEAGAVRRYFKNVEWFELDDGYTSYCEKNIDLDAHGIGAVYEGEDGIDAAKFPNGLKGYTDKIRKLGFKPSVWIGGLCPKKSKIYLEHPEWFTDYEFRIDYSEPLDVSIKEVREYMDFAVNKFVKEYGFDGIKHDFWSYSFEDRHDLLKFKDRSGYEYREWWHRSLREKLPEYGYLQSCCDFSMGDPFIGKYFNNYRFGLDVAAGKWENIKTSVFWSVAVLSPHTGDLFIPNSDSIGLLPALSDDDFMFVVNWQIVTRTLVEISGRFSRVDENDKRLKILQRAVSYLNNGENVYFAKYDYRKKGVVLPEIIYIDTAFDRDDGTYKTVAVFNGSEETKRIFFTNEDVGLKKGFHDVLFVWEGYSEKLDFYEFVLQPHKSVLLKIKKATEK